ncbi:hypothetical protein LSUB1_G008720, partial [Lachnellula subtilissima]
MSEAKEAPPTAPITQQPVPQSQPVDSPAYKQITTVIGTEKWTNGLFDCFTGDDNLCTLPIHVSKAASAPASSSAKPKPASAIRPSRRTSASTMTVCFGAVRVAVMRRG